MAKLCGLCVWPISSDSKVTGSREQWPRLPTGLASASEPLAQGNRREDAGKPASFLGRDGRHVTALRVFTDHGFAPITWLRPGMRTRVAGRSEMKG